MSLISREAAIRKLQDKGEEPMHLHTDEDWKCGLFMAEDIINDLPTAERVGKWVEFDSAEDKYDVIKCPFCKHTFTVDSYHWTDIGFIKDDFKYCPNCGARIIGEEDEADRP